MENGVNEVKKSADGVENDCPGVRTIERMVKIRRGTASHKTEDKGGRLGLSSMLVSIFVL